MQRMPRIGIQIEYGEPYWVQVREAIKQQGRSCSAEIVEISIPEAHLLSPNEQLEVVEGLVVQDLHALILNDYPPALIARLLERGLPVVYMAEHSQRHPRFASRTGLYDAGALAGAFLEARLPADAAILIIGGEPRSDAAPMDGEDDGRSRIDGFLGALAAGRHASVHQVLCSWANSIDEARGHTERHLAKWPRLSVDAIFGLSDTLALGALHACRDLGRLRDGAPVVGINGDPMALAAISIGQMAATVEFDLDDLAKQAFDLALRAARGAPLPPLFRCGQQLVTSANVVEAATRKLISLADLPTRLIEEKQRHEQQRLMQLETSEAIDRKVGLLLDEQQLSQALTSLIRDSYGYDHGRFLRLDPESGQVVPPSDRCQATMGVATGTADQADPLAYALTHCRLVFIPDTSASQRFPPDPLWPETRSRVIVPVRLGGQLFGLLDLHSCRVSHHTREELTGLQLLADRVGITVRNAQLYHQEQEARALAERADRVKTTLLANVSHELRTPLNIILGYSQGALDALAHGDLAATDLADNLAQIYRSGEHLLRLINDLLDLSRAEIGELDLMPVRFEPRELLEEVFKASAESFGTSDTIAWRLHLPPTLPAIDADPVRLRQILLNLLHNAYKFTERGTITLGAEATSTDLHLWVADTGSGIDLERREQIFAPLSVAGVVCEPARASASG